MRRLLLLFLICFSVKSVAQHPVVVIAIDGFAYDYLAQYQPKNMLALMANGATTKGLIPSYPSKTFPNFLTLATGVYPGEHGIVHNSFYHRSLKQHYKKGAGKNQRDWLTAIPIWSLAEQQGIKTAVYFWPEAEAKTAMPKPSYLVPYQHNTSSEKGIEQIFNWLSLPEAQRPALIMSYFSVIDNIGHRHGSDSNELAQAITKLDQQLGQLFTKITEQLQLTPNIVLVSDHGMINIDRNHMVNWPELVKPFEKLHIVNGQTQLYLYEKDQQRINDVRSHLMSLPQAKLYNVYQKGQYPQHWHFNQASATIPDLVVDAIAPTTFVENFSFLKLATYSSATHGFDPKATPQMTAVFIANGPNIPAGITIEPFENIHIMPLLAKLIELPLAEMFNNRQQPFMPIGINTKK